MRRLIPILLSFGSAVPASAQQSGLLLGLSSDSGYRTVWIAPRGGSMAVAARQPALIVPRADGFHHIGIVRWCSITDYGEVPNSGPFVDETDKLVDLGVGAAPPRPDSGWMACRDVDSIVGLKRDSTVRADSIALANAKTEADSLDVIRYESESDRCGFYNIEITFLRARYVSTRVESGTTEYCNPGRYTWSEERVTLRGDTSVAFLDFLPAARAKRLTARWEAEKGECAGESSPDDSWGIVRSLGGWQLAFATSGATACRGRSGNEEDGFTIKEPAPRAIAGGEPTTRWLAAARRVAPKLDDIFVSPRNDLVILREAGLLSAFVPQNGQLGSARLAVELRSGEKVVMAEWASGVHVKRWTDQITALKERW